MSKETLSIIQEEIITELEIRIKELEESLQEFIDYASNHSLIGQTKQWKDKFKQTLNKKC